ncbi:hypothetical protein ACLB2K_018146 [Fragaria x ananassa]
MPSSYLSKVRTAVQRSIVGQEGVLLQDSLDGLIGQGKLLFGNSRLFQSRPFLAVSDLQAFLPQGIVVAARSDSQRKQISVVGEISRIISTPSVSGPSFQVCGYHIDSVLSDPSQLRNKAMAFCGSKALVGRCSPDTLTSRRGLFSMLPESAGACYNSRSKTSVGFRKASMSLKNNGQPNTNATFGYFVYEVGKRWCNNFPLNGFGSRVFHSSSTCFSAGTAQDVSFDNSAPEEQLSTSADSSDQKNTDAKSLKLSSGSCYLPHPDKEDTGGEDAHFICVNEQAIGVADGVGGWADLGVNSGLYSRELMSNSVTAVQEEPKGSVDPARVLEKAHSSTKAKGSSTACIIALTEQGIHAINLGDSGFIVVRDGCTVFRSPVQQHDFNFTYQLENGINSDLPSSGQVFTVPVAPGDVIVAGTDGLFDNLYNNEITAVVVHAMRAGLGPQCEPPERIEMLRSEIRELSNKNGKLKTQLQDLTEKLRQAEQGKDHAHEQFSVLGKPHKAGPFGTVKGLRTNPTVTPDESVNPRLAKILEGVAVHKELIVVLANSNVKPMLEVQVTSIKKAGITNYLVVSLDNQIEEFCKANDVPVYSRDPDEGIDSIAKTGGNHAVSGLKFRILREFLQLGYGVLLSDVDIVYLQNPFNHLYRDSDVESMTDGHNNMTAYGYNDVFDEPSMGWARYAHTMRIWVYNSGFFYIRPTLPSIELLDRVAGRLSREKAWDQAVFNEELYFPSHPGYDGLHAAKRTMDFYMFMNSKTNFRE